MIEKIRGEWLFKNLFSGKPNDNIAIQKLFIEEIICAARINDLYIEVATFPNRNKLIYATDYSGNIYSIIEYSIMDWNRLREYIRRYLFKQGYVIDDPDGILELYKFSNETEWRYDRNLKNRYIPIIKQIHIND